MQCLVAYVVRVLRTRRTELWTRSTTFCAAGGLNFRAPHLRTSRSREYTHQLTNSVAQGGLLETPAASRRDRSGIAASLPHQTACALSHHTKL